jgi:hypothetical protein
MLLCAIACAHAVRSPHIHTYWHDDMYDILAYISRDESLAVAFPLSRGNQEHMPYLSCVCQLPTRVAALVLFADQEVTIWVCNSI